MAKNIVVCCDGTGNQYHENKTNVVKLVESIPKGHPEQIVFYDPGVGTMGANFVVTKTAKFLTRVIGLAFAYGITNNIEDAYAFLMDHYKEEDKVFLFGFSRGAYTVRALAGMLHKCGLLRQGNKNLLPYASRMYRKGSDEIAMGFKETFSRECKPHFVGVWDTVKSVGLFVPRKFPNAKLNKDVACGYHAIAIDEKRSNFRPNLWDEPVAGQTIEQVWFSGVHSDVGGYYDTDGLSNIALKWMLSKAKAQGLLVDIEKYQSIHADAEGKLHNSLLPIWWVLGWWRRRIEKGVKVHESVFERMNANDSYKPRNLPPRNDINIAAASSLES